MLKEKNSVLQEIKAMEAQKDIEERVKQLECDAWGTKFAIIALFIFFAIFMIVQGVHNHDTNIHKTCTTVEVPDSITGQFKEPTTGQMYTVTLSSGKLKSELRCD
jgi:hypothetical protein